MRACPLTFFSVFNTGNAGVHRGKESKEAKKAKPRARPESALDLDAQRHENYCHYQRHHGGPNRLAGNTIQGVGGGNPVGFAFWRIDLGNFLWKYPDQ
jgi:hypothetical protein